jgi:hypothetical protein
MSEDEPRQVTTSRAPLVAGALLGAAGGTAVMMAVTLFAGAPDWYLIGLGGTFDGAFLGVIVGAIVREHQAGRDRTRTHGLLRVICVWAGIGLCVSLALAIMMGLPWPVSALVGTALGTAIGAIISRIRHPDFPYM